MPDTRFEEDVAIRFIRCLGCGEPLYSDESQRLGAGAACRIRLGPDELDLRRQRVLAGSRAHLWTVGGSRGPERD